MDEVKTDLGVEVFPNMANRIKQAVREEYKRAAEKYGPLHASSHEAYAVILEEAQEAEAELDELRRALTGYWNAVKDNNKIACGFRLSDIGAAAEHLAAESIQVAAMAHKALLTYEATE